jgi:hypothetical protein
VIGRASGSVSGWLDKTLPHQQQLLVSRKSYSWTERTLRCSAVWVLEVFDIQTISRALHEGANAIKNVHFNILES